MDTGLVLQLRRALVLIESDLAQLGDVLAAQAQQQFPVVVKNDVVLHKNFAAAAAGAALQAKLRQAIACLLQTLFMPVRAYHPQLPPPSGQIKLSADMLGVLF